MHSHIHFSVRFEAISKISFYMWIAWLNAYIIVCLLDAWQLYPLQIQFLAFSVLFWRGNVAWEVRFAIQAQKLKVVIVCSLEDEIWGNGMQYSQLLEGESTEDTVFILRNYFKL